MQESTQVPADVAANAQPNTLKSDGTALPGTLLRAELDKVQPSIDRQILNIQALKDIKGTDAAPSGEYAAFVVLLNTSGLAADGNINRVAGDLYQAFQVFRENPQRPGEIVSRGLKGSEGRYNIDGPVNTLLDNVATMNNGIHPTDLKLVSLVALACGEPGAAMRVIKQGNARLKQKNSVGVGFADVAPVFAKARELDPLPEAYDVAISGLGEDFSPEDPAATAFIAQAAARRTVPA